MNFSQEIINVLEYLFKKIGVTIDWTNENVVPLLKDLCEKLVHWEIKTSYAWIIISGIIFLLGLIFAIIIYKCGDWCGVEWFLFAIIAVATITGICVQVFDIIECNTFPEKFIYEYLQSLMQNKTY